MANKTLHHFVVVYTLNGKASDKTISPRAEISSPVLLSAAERCTKTTYCKNSKCILLRWNRSFRQLNLSVNCLYKTVADNRYLICNARASPINPVASDGVGGTGETRGVRGGSELIATCWETFTDHGLLFRPLHPQAFDREADTELNFN